MHFVLKIVPGADGGRSHTTSQSYNRGSYNAGTTVLTDQISSAIGKGEYVIGLFLDLGKAFETIYHAMLFDKLYRCGV